MFEPTAISRALDLFNTTQQPRLQRYLDQLAAVLDSVYVYRAVDGTPEFIVIRLRTEQGKTFRICHFSGDKLIFKKPAQPEGGHALFGGHLAAIYPEATILVCEGEKATLAALDFIHRAGGLARYIAVTSGSAKSAGSANWSALTDRDVQLWPDNDAAGTAYVNEVHAVIRDTARSCRFINIAPLGLPAHGDAAEWVALQAGSGIEGIASLPLLDSLPAADNAPPVEAPLPLFREIEGRQTLNPDDLGPMLGAAAKAITAAVQCPMGISVGAVLAAAALCVQGHANISVDGREVPLSLYILTVAASGERKTSADKLAMASVRRFQKQTYAAYKLAVKAHKALLRSLPKDAIPPDAPIDPTILVQDTTLDAMIRNLINGYPSQGMIVSEGGSFLGGYAMSADLLLRTAAFLAAIWSGESISQSRVTGRHMADDRRLSIHLQGQPEVMAGFIGNELLQSQGILQRFLMSDPETQIGSRLYARSDIGRDAAYQVYLERLDSLLAITLPIDATGELAPRALSLSAGAYALWVNAHDAIERAAATGGALENFRAYAAKLAEQILRLAGVITGFEDIAATEVSETTMLGAIRLANFYLHEAMHLLSGPGDKQLDEAKELLDWMRRAASPVALRDIYRLGPMFARTASRARKAVATLVEHGWVIAHEGTVTTQDSKLSRENFKVRAGV